MLSRGLLSWMSKELAAAEQRRGAHLKKREDAQIGGRIQLVTEKLRKPAYLFRSPQFDGIDLAWVQEHGGEQIFPFSGAFGRNLADMPEDEAARYCEENKVQSGITKIIKTGFSAGPNEAAGKYRQEGKTYVVQDGDFKFNVSGEGKK